VHRAFRAILYVSLPLMIVVTVGIILGAAGGHDSHTHYGFTWVAFMAQFSAAAAYNITYAPYVSDYSRYLPESTPPRSVIAAVFFGASTSAFWLITIGAWLAIRLGATDGLAGLQTAGNNVIPHLGGIAAMLSALALAATMGMNAYGGALSLLTAVDSFKSFKPTRAARIIAILLLTVIWYVIGEAISGSAVDTVFTALTLMLYLLVPWTATNLMDYFFVRRGRYAITELFRLDGIYGRWAWRGLTAYAIGFLAEIPFMILPSLGNWSYTGFMASRIQDIDIAWLVGLFVTSVVYLLLARSFDLQAENAAIQASDAQLLAIDRESEAEATS
jgi:purine-cytosine permease-like protein